MVVAELAALALMVRPAHLPELELLVQVMLIATTTIPALTTLAQVEPVLIQIIQVR